MLFAAGSALSLLFSMLLFGHIVPLSYGSVLLGAGMEQMGPAAFVIYGALTAALAIGLWKRQPWARRAAILVAVVGVALAVPAISSAVVDERALSVVREGIQIMVRVAVVFYLSQQPVRDWFARAPM